MSEHQIQVAMCKYMDLLKVPYFAIPNGGARHLMIAKKLKAEGVKAGVADLFIMLPNEFYHGLFIETKTDSGRQSDKQKEFQQKCFEYGYAYKIIRSVAELAEFLDSYGLPKTSPRMVGTKLATHSNAI